MKIKRLLLKMGGFCEPMRPMSTRATRRARNGEKGGMQRGGRARRGTGSPGEDSVFDWMLGKITLLPPQSAGSKMS